MEDEGLLEVGVIDEKRRCGRDEGSCGYLIDKALPMLERQAAKLGRMFKAADNHRE